MNYKVKATGLDSTTIKLTSPFKTTGIDYFLTSINANNDFLVSPLVKENPTSEVLVLIDEIPEDFETLLLSHLIELGKTSAVLVFNHTIDLSNNSDAVNQIRKLYKDGVVKNYGIYCPENYDELLNLETYLKCNVIFVITPICPLDFNYELIKRAEERDNIVVGINPFGGHINGPTLIDSFTAPYLIKFCATYSDIILFSGRNILASQEYSKYVVKILSEEVDNNFKLNKSIHSLPNKEIKKAVYTYLKVAGNDGFVVEYDFPEVVYDPTESRISLGMSPEVFPDNLEIEVKESKTTKEIRDFLELLEDRSNPEESLELRYSRARYKVLAYLRLLFKDHIFDIIPLGKRTIAISTLHYKKLNWFQKHILGKDPKVEVHKFVFTVFGDGKTLFLEIE